MKNIRKINKAKRRRKDYEHKRNIARNRPKGQRMTLRAGDGILPYSRKSISKKVRK